MKKRPSLKLIAVLSVVALVVAGCETMGESAGLGAVLGSGIGAIIGHQSGNALTGALIGGAVGAGFGAAAKHFQNVKAEKRERALMDQNQTNSQWHAENPGQSVPREARMELVSDKTMVTPSNTLRSGDMIECKLVYRVVGTDAYQGGICRTDIVQHREKGQFNNVLEIPDSCALTSAGTNEHVTGFTIPDGVEPGNYRMYSALFDADTNEVRVEHMFYFTIL